MSLWTAFFLGPFFQPSWLYLFFTSNASHDMLGIPYHVLCLSWHSTACPFLPAYNSLLLDLLFWSPFYPILMTLLFASFSVCIACTICPTALLPYPPALPACPTRLPYPTSYLKVLPNVLPKVLPKSPTRKFCPKSYCCPTCCLTCCLTCCSTRLPYCCTTACPAACLTVVCCLLSDPEGTLTSFKSPLVYRILSPLQSLSSTSAYLQC